MSFQVRQGEIFGLLGANGAGKTTLIKMLTGIFPPTAGEGSIAGVDIRHAGHAIKERIGYMSQSFSLYHDLTVWENLRFFTDVYGVPRSRQKERLAHVLRLSGLNGRERDLTASLPMGIRQRLALACAIVHGPRMLFLDEPTSGVDPMGRRRFWEILTYLSRVEGVAILVTTHYMSEAEHCDRLALMDAGKIIADDAPHSLKEALRRDAGELVELTVDKPLQAIEALRERYPGTALFGTRIHVFVRNIAEERHHLASLLGSRGITIRTLRPQLPSLEDVFIVRISEREQRRRL